MNTFWKLKMCYFFLNLKCVTFHNFLTHTHSCRNHVIRSSWPSGHLPLRLPSLNHMYPLPVTLYTSTCPLNKQFRLNTNRPERKQTFDFPQKDSTYWAAVIHSTTILYFWVSKCWSSILKYSVYLNPFH